MRAIFAVVLGALAFAGAPSAASQPTLYIPAIHVYAPLASTLDQGPVVQYRSDTTLSIAAHRTHGPHLFYYLNKLKKGDLVRTEGRNFYVDKWIVVPATQVWVLRYHGVVLTACSTLAGLPTDIRYRIVVFARER